MAKLASAGAMNIRANMLMMVPTNEKMIPVERALYACPFSAIGCPSNIVPMEAGVPGILSRMADMSPPETDPTYNAMSIAIPSMVDKP